MNISRRSFIKGLCLLTSGWTVKGWAAPLMVSDSGSTLHRVSETRTHMGTFVTITLFHPSPDLGQEIIASAFSRLETLLHFYNRHESGSPLSYLNRQGSLKNPPLELLTILNKAQKLHAWSGGLFDVTIKPVLDLYEEAYSLGTLPESATVRKTLSRVGLPSLEISRKKIAFKKEGMGITLDGLAKGTVIDGTIQFLKQKGIKHALVEAGGDLRVIGGRGPGSPWRIVVYNPLRENETLEPIALSEGAVATSGCYFVHFDPRQDHFHILSPETGGSPLFSTSATVVAPTAEEADGLATSLMLLSPDRALSAINRDGRLAALIIAREGQKIPSAGWARFGKNGAPGLSNG